MRNSLNPRTHWNTRQAPLLPLILGRKRYMLPGAGLLAYKTGQNWWALGSAREWHPGLFSSLHKHINMPKYLSTCTCVHPPTHTRPHEHMEKRGGKWHRVDFNRRSLPCTQKQSESQNSRDCSRRTVQVWDQLGLQSKTLSLKWRKKKTEKGDPETKGTILFRRNLKPRKCGRRWHLILFHLSKPVLYRC